MKETVQDRLVKIRNAMIVLGITTDWLFERIKEDIQRGDDKGARIRLAFVDKIVAPESTDGLE